MSEYRPKVYVLAPVHSRRAITEQFIRCLLAQTYGRWHLVLIDDGSTDGTADMARSLVPSLTVLEGNGNWWWAGSLHQGHLWLKKCAAPDDVVLIMNDDTEFAPDFIERGITTLKPKTLLMAQPYSLRTGKRDEVGVHWDWKTLVCRGVDDLKIVNCFSTRGLFHRVADMDAIGGFRPWLLPHYFSDYEYTIRAHGRGFALISVPDVKLFYHEDKTGIREPEKGQFLEVIRKSFTKRAIHNPIYWAIFVLCCSPFRYVPVNLVRVMRRYISVVWHSTRHPDSVHITTK